MIVHHSSSVTLKNKQTRIYFGLTLIHTGSEYKYRLKYIHTHFLIIGAEGSSVS